jgi:hypothetical protein
MNEKPQPVRSQESGVEAAQEVEERRRVAEIARDIEELGRALERRDRLRSFGTAGGARSVPALAAKFTGGVGDRSTPEPESLPTVADMSSASEDDSFPVGKFATIRAIPQQRKPVAEVSRPARRRKWWLSQVIIVLLLASSGTLMLVARPIEIAQIAQDAYRSAVAVMQRCSGSATQ